MPEELQGVDSRIAMLYRNCMACTNLDVCGRLVMTTVWIADPNAMYESAPADANSTMTNAMTPVSARGNFSGSFIDSVIGMTNPMPSKVNTAVPMNSGKSLELNMTTSAKPSLDTLPISYWNR